MVIVSQIFVKAKPVSTYVLVNKYINVLTESELSSDQNNAVVKDQ